MMASSLSYFAVTLLAVFIILQTLSLTFAFGVPPPERLRRLLEATDRGDSPILLLPCCYDGLTARLVGLSGCKLCATYYLLYIQIAIELILYNCLFISNKYDPIILPLNNEYIRITTKQRTIHSN